MSASLEPAGLLFVRIAGLPVEVMAPFASPLCRDHLLRLEAAEAALEAARQQLVDHIFPLISGAAPERRRFLLAVKRDAYNGRSIAKYAARPEWQEYLQSARAAADRAFELEQELGRLEAELASLFAAELEREHQALLPHLENGTFLRAINLGSPLVAGQLANLPRSGSAAFSRRDKRLQASLLRYLSRAALKLSPFSSFTPLALGELGETPGAAAWLTESFGERSLLRVQPAFLDQVSALLLSCRAFQALLEVQVNPTLEEVAPGTFRWLRSGHWQVEAEPPRMFYHPDAFLKSALKDRLMIELSRWPGRRWSRLDELETELRSSLPELSPGQLATRFEQLRRLGFLLFELPWSGNTRHLDAEMGAMLGAAADPALETLGRAIGRLAELESLFADEPQAGAAIAALDRQVEVIWQLSLGLAPAAAAGIPYVRIKENQFFDDVLRAPALAPNAPLLRLPGRRLRELSAAAWPLVHFANLADRRFEFLHALNDLLAEQWPGENEIGIFEVFEKAKSLFAAFIRWEKDGQTAAFAPSESAAALELAALRREVRAALNAAAYSEAGASFLDPTRLAAALALIPAAYRCELGPCLFVQPADAEGRLWVANRLYEGSGRYSSRFLALLDAETYGRFAHSFLAAAGDGSEARPFLLDLMFAQGDTLNVHLPLTSRYVAYPGEGIEAAAAVKVELGALRVRRGEPGQLPTLVDQQGLRYLPVHLSGAARRFLPTLFRFLSFFGPSELLLQLPASHLHVCGAATVRERMTLGNLVLLRQRWVFDQQDLPAGLQDLSELEAYRAIDRWRRQHGMPEKVFLIENVHHATRKDLYKPQYLDLTSPLFVALLRSALKQHQGVVSFEEMLPESGAAPVGPNGQGYLIEVLAEAPACSVGMEKSS